MRAWVDRGDAALTGGLCVVPDVLCAVCLSIFTPRTAHRRFYCDTPCRKASYRIRRGNTLKRLNRKFRREEPT